jgi:hypothetical protein
MKTLKDALEELNWLDVDPDEIKIPRDIFIYITQKAREIFDDEDKEE